MNIICPICSELLGADLGIVSTSCGHVFHQECLDSWLRNSRTCPTCRKSSTNLIKLFFEVDESRDTLRIDEILKTNEQLSQSVKDSNGKIQKLETELKEAREKLQKSTNEETHLKIQKRADDMAIAGLKSVKDDAVEKYIKLTESFQSLKLDYLAERQLRRSQQVQLGKLVPNDENYDTAKLQSDDPGKATNHTNGVPEPSDLLLKVPAAWSLSCEASVGSVSSNISENDSDYDRVPPRKIQKTAKEPPQKSTDKLSDRVLLFRGQRNFFKNEKKPKGFPFSPPELSSSQPSTSDGRSHRRFGENGLFSSAISIPRGSSTSHEQIFRFSPSTSPSFSFSSALSSPLQSYRDVGETSPPNSPRPLNGPKASER